MRPWPSKLSYYTYTSSTQNTLRIEIPRLRKSGKLDMGNGDGADIFYKMYYHSLKSHKFRVFIFGFA